GQKEVSLFGTIHNFKNEQTILAVVHIKSCPRIFQIACFLAVRSCKCSHLSPLNGMQRGYDTVPLVRGKVLEAGKRFVQCCKGRFLRRLHVTVLLLPFLYDLVVVLPGGATTH